VAQPNAARGAAFSTAGLKEYARRPALAATLAVGVPPVLKPAAKPPGSALREPPHDVREPPHDVREPPHDVREPPHDVREPPHDVREPPHVAALRLDRDPDRDPDRDHDPDPDPDHDPGGRGGAPFVARLPVPP
jgi:hypothetical protein